MIRLKHLLTEGSGALTGNWLKKGTWIAKELIRRGFKGHEAAAIVGNMWAESTFDSTSKNNIGAIGLLQWRGSRADALKNFAKKRGTTWTDFQTQLDFIVYELKTKYDGTYGYETHMFNTHVKPELNPVTAADKFAQYSERPNGDEYNMSIKTRKIASKSVYDELTAAYHKNKKSTDNKNKGVTAGASNALKNIYVVRSGDSASVIAAKYNITTSKLKQLNPSIKDINKIQIGQKLRVG